MKWKREIIASLREGPKPLSELARECGTDPWVIQNAARALHREGLVERWEEVAYVGRGRPCVRHVYRLPSK